MEIRVSSIAEVRDISREMAGGQSTDWCVIYKIIARLSGSV